MKDLYNIFLYALLIVCSGCSRTQDLMIIDKAEHPISAQIIKDMHKKRTDQHYPSLIRIFKSENILEIWKYTYDEQYILFKTYKICTWSGLIGPKIETGDRQAPEGFYKIRADNLNPHSRYHLSINIGFPNEFDMEHNRTGADIMIHGGCTSAGCYAMTDRQIQEIYSIIRDSLRGKMQSYVQIQVFPFRLTKKNMDFFQTHSFYSFWKMLQIGYDYFEKTHKEPIVRVLNKQYVFFKNPPEQNIISYHL
ncbi:MAG: murein L,D-transpeptidase [Candidatus Liberibacter ctenarytainae]|uniref:Murein L,D-transpeptidase n=1 Tax=Candidatus Liberibacter ctenarytainae TaxID=2020335 RepID=A0A937AK12_9HYPH|nr:murein L,D-transpeptidase [Candidatus Liberibacter ctenarytainae]